MKKLVAILALFFTVFLGAIDLQTASKMELMNLKGVGCGNRRCKLRSISFLQIYVFKNILFLKTSKVNK